MKEKDFKVIHEAVLNPIGETMFSLLTSVGAAALEEQIITTLISNWIMTVNERRVSNGKEETTQETFNEYVERLQNLLPTILKIREQNPNVDNINIEEKTDRKRVRFEEENDN
jgi:hypothetical protein|tara:strand:+ start:15192 stop:15530 length:339 start_codon:yes stop_codon:yes gene_type:complete